MDLQNILVADLEYDRIINIELNKTYDLKMNII
jgi:hypothetical protein